MEESALEYAIQQSQQADRYAALKCNLSTWILSKVDLMDLRCKKASMHFVLTFRLSAPVPAPCLLCCHAICGTLSSLVCVH